MFDPALISDVIRRLEADRSLSKEVAELALAALLGEVEECLGGNPPARPAPEDVNPAQPVRAFIESISVEGFRGIGPRARLDLSPGPGLTLVVGRNGSGKSSFAEALELLLTGDNQRWSARRSKIWKDGWKNLHHKSATAIETELLIDGQPGPMGLKRSWKPDDDLTKGVTTLLQREKSLGSVTALGWDQPITTYRPFLSYNELGSMLEEGPSKLYDALASILGLEEIVQAASDLASARKTRAEAHRETGRRLEEIRPVLERLDDERARKSLAAITGRRWNLEELANVLGGAPTRDGEDSELELLRELSKLRAPETDRIAAVCREVRTALEEVQSLAGTDADKARRTAEILTRALELHAHHGNGDCPVCGNRGVIDDKWRDSATAAVTRLREEAETAEKAHRHLRDAEWQARTLITPVPAFLARASAVHVDAVEVEQSWHAWSETAKSPRMEVAEELEPRGAALAAACEKVSREALRMLAEKEDAWRPVAQTLTVWLEGAKSALAGSEALKQLKEAEDWLQDTAKSIRNERFLPIKERVKAIWDLLRTQSNVDLRDVTFEGKATSRRVNLEVNVDGTEGVALGVMSQGELHSLALSLFLPRATLDVSPFRFLFIDDPVQAMDPAKVDGLARALDQVAKDRQVVVFTHDDRLPQAVRYLGIKATVIEVLRRENSVVELRTVASPIERYLDDARALARTDELPSAVGDKVVPGLCRQSLEAACIEVVRRRRLTRGEAHTQVEALLESNTKLLPRLALALFDDPQKAGEVLRTLNNKYGHWSGDVVQACNRGAHGGPQMPSVDLVRSSTNLVHKLLELS